MNEREGDRYTIFVELEFISTASGLTVVKLLQRVILFRWYLERKSTGRRTLASNLSFPNEQ